MAGLVVVDEIEVEIIVVDEDEDGVELVVVEEDEVEEVEGPVVLQAPVG